MLVVLIITSLVVGLAFSVLQLVQKQMHGMEIHYEQRTEINRLRQALWLDMNICDRAYFDPVQNQLILSTNARDLRYKFLSNHIIREIDTFQFRAYSWEVYFENKMPINNEIDAIQLNLKPKIQNFKLQTPDLFVYKTNSATTYMNN